ncbi:MAG TPA: NADH-quinone oxidoreductase subunit NuoN, partial [Acidiphilium sp.]
MTILYSVLPVLFLAVAGMVLLMFGVFSRRDHTFSITGAAVVALAITARLIFAAPDGQVFHGMLVTGDFTRFADMMVLVGAIGSLSLSVAFNEKTGITRFEFPLLILFSVVGMIVMISAGDLLTLYIGFEIQSLALYVLAAFARNNVRSSEAGLKYFVLSSLASGLLLYGISLVYGFSGTIGFAGIAHALAGSSAMSIGSTVGIVFVLVGLAFKISVAPFHMWTPDVYEGAPTSVTTFFAVAPKVATFAILLRVMLGPFGSLLAQWQDLVQIIAAVSMIVGALGAIGQSNIKRLMAYSSIGHMGYALMGLAAGTVAGVRGSLIYLSIYLVMSLGTFGCIVAMIRKGKPVERIDDLAGMASEDGKYALAMAVLLLAMTGIPPLSGFFGKLYVFLAAIRSGLDVLAVIGVATSAVSAFYYLRIIKVMYFDAGSPGFDRRTTGMNLVIGVSAVVTALFVFYPSPLSTATTY